MEGGMEGGMNTELWLSHADDVRPQVDLQRMIWDELHWEPDTDNRGIDVEVADFVVTLRGTAPSYPARMAAERAAERVPGIRAVINEIAVTPPASEARGDGVLAAAVANALVWDVRVPHVKLAERVVEGWVTLEGAVGRQYERDAAEETVANLTGVRGITNLIAVEPVQPPADLQRKAEAAVEHASLRGSRISPETHDQTVVLRGRVHSLAERLAAEHAVWAIPGVAAVEDLLTVRG